MQRLPLPHAPSDAHSVTAVQWLDIPRPGVGGASKGHAAEKGVEGVARLVDGTVSSSQCSRVCPRGSNTLFGCPVKPWPSTPQDSPTRGPTQQSRHAVSTKAPHAQTQSRGHIKTHESGRRNAGDGYPHHLLVQGGRRIEKRCHVEVVVFAPRVFRERMGLSLLVAILPAQCLRWVMEPLGVSLMYWDGLWRFCRGLLVVGECGIDMASWHRP